MALTAERTRFVQEYAAHYCISDGVGRSLQSRSPLILKVRATLSMDCFDCVGQNLIVVENLRCSDELLEKGFAVKGESGPSLHVLTSLAGRSFGVTGESCAGHANDLEVRDRVFAITLSLVVEGHLRDCSVAYLIPENRSRWAEVDRL